MDVHSIWTSARLLCVVGLLFSLNACSCDSDDGAGNDNDGGVGNDGAADNDGALGVDGATRPDGSTSRCDQIIATVRDFRADHVDFENSDHNAVVPGLVQNTLTDEHKPVYAHGSQGMAAITSAESFSQWYRDLPDINQAFEVSLPLSREGEGRFVFDDQFFFPIDGQGFGNSGRDEEDRERNFHFTTEIHTSFTYSGGESFTFRGDDDLWMFVDGKLALDLGGLHSAAEQTVNMDMLGLEVGETYAMDIFHAERHTTASTFRIETSIECFMDPVIR